MFTNIAILNFEEDNPPSSDDKLYHQVLIKTDMQTDTEIEGLITAIANIKEHADSGESISDFIIPDNWDDYGWDEKINIVCEHMATFTGRFDTDVTHLVAYAAVN